MEKQDMKELLEKIESMKQKFDRELADSVLEVCIRANQHIIDELRGDDRVCQALLEIMEPEINKIKKEGGIEDTGLKEKGRQLQPAGEISFMKGLVQGARAVIPAIWLAGVFCLCVIYLCRFLELQKKTADAVFSSGDGCWVAGQVDMPFVMPYIRPRIYLPESLADSVPGF